MRPLTRNPLHARFAVSRRTFVGTGLRRRGPGAVVLAHLFPRSEVDLLASAAEAAAQRCWSGIHFPLDDNIGLEMGYQIGRLVNMAACAEGAEEIGGHGGGRGEDRPGRGTRRPRIGHGGFGWPRCRSGPGHPTGGLAPRTPVLSLGHEGAFAMNGRHSLRATMALLALALIAGIAAGPDPANSPPPSVLATGGNPVQEPGRPSPERLRAAPVARPDPGPVAASGLGRFPGEREARTPHRPAARSAARKADPVPASMAALANSVSALPIDRGARSARTSIPAWLWVNPRYAWTGWPKTVAHERDANGIAGVDLGKPPSWGSRPAQSALGIRSDSTRPSPERVRLYHES